MRNLFFFGKVEKATNLRPTLSKVDKLRVRKEMNLLGKEILIKEAPICDRHPGVEASLCCHQCQPNIRPQCIKFAWANHYICIECVQTYLRNFFRGDKRDYVITASIALPLACLIVFVLTILIAATSLAGGIHWLAVLITLLVTPFASSLVAEGVLWGVRKRHRRYLTHVVVGCFTLAVMIFAPVPYLIAGWTGLVVPVLILFISTGTAIAFLGDDADRTKLISFKANIS